MLAVVTVAYTAHTAVHLALPAVVTLENGSKHLKQNVTHLLADRDLQVGTAVTASGVVDNLGPNLPLEMLCKICRTNPAQKSCARPCRLYGSYPAS